MECDNNNNDNTADQSVPHIASTHSSAQIHTVQDLSNIYLERIAQLATKGKITFSIISLEQPRQ